MEHFCIRRNPLIHAFSAGLSHQMYQHPRSVSCSIIRSWSEVWIQNRITYPFPESKEEPWLGKEFFTNQAYFPLLRDKGLKIRLLPFSYSGNQYGCCVSNKCLLLWWIKFDMKTRNKQTCDLRVTMWQIFPYCFSSSLLYLVFVRDLRLLYPSFCSGLFRTCVTFIHTIISLTSHEIESRPFFHVKFILIRCSSQKLLPKLFIDPESKPTQRQRLHTCPFRQPYQKKFTSSLIATQAERYVRFDRFSQFGWADWKTRLPQFVATDFSQRSLTENIRKRIRIIRNFDRMRTATKHFLTGRVIFFSWTRKPEKAVQHSMWEPNVTIKIFDIRHGSRIFVLASHG